MMNRKELIERVTQLYITCDQCEPVNDVYAFALFSLLSGSAKDTLDALVNAGPLHDGDNIY